MFWGDMDPGSVLIRGKCIAFAEKQPLDLCEPFRVPETWLPRGHTDHAQAGRARQKQRITSMRSPADGKTLIAGVYHAVLPPRLAGAPAPTGGGSNERVSEDILLPVGAAPEAAGSAGNALDSVEDHDITDLDYWLQIEHEQGLDWFDDEGLLGMG